MSENICKPLAPNSGVSSKAPMASSSCAVYSVSDSEVDTESIGKLIEKLAEGTWNDFLSTNKHMGGKASKFAGSLVVGGAVAAAQGAKTPLGWAMSGFGALPHEFTKSGALQVFNLSAGQRLGRVALAAGTKFVLVTIAFEGGVLVGSLINQLLPEETQMAIGGTINEIVNNGGYKELWKHPFGIGM